MRKGNRVKILQRTYYDLNFGEGTLIKKEGELGIFSQRWLIKIDECPTKSLKDLQQHQGGLYFNESEFEVLK